MSHQPAFYCLYNDLFLLLGLSETKQRSDGCQVSIKSVASRSIEPENCLIGVAILISVFNRNLCFSYPTQTTESQGDACWLLSAKFCTKLLDNFLASCKKWITSMSNIPYGQGRKIGMT